MVFYALLFLESSITRSRPLPRILMCLTIHIPQRILAALLHQIIHRHILRPRHLRQPLYQIHRQAERLIHHLRILLYYKHTDTSRLSVELTTQEIESIKYQFSIIFPD